MTPFSVEFLGCIGVGSCGCPISVSIFLRWTASFTLMKIPPSSDSAVEEMTDFMICAMLRMDPLFGGMYELVENKNFLLLYCVLLVFYGSLCCYGLKAPFRSHYTLARSLSGM